ncbi:carboxypeptidase-like regulatory domain-containing protein [Maribellus maritimus]|uniref:carboxypeptidase-like regulatory domain-containing protein n=1 Tax=Maribellus maritimus TaxID=2870838 RepID=UPI001EEA07DA|nr:carboxypeptidase-like regulatory domain-containing protein [Maribellus maritimus]MCG6189419.1 carboxypeptidase-like regulatory domain-containing protein [Maribellus maritimus]
MPKNKKHISNENFQRYLNNQKTDAERNAFEREMQKNPFEAEALEGMQQFSAEEIQKDLDQLSKRIAEKKRRNTPIWAAAATILLLFSVGIIWFQLRNTSPVPEMAEIKNTEIQQEKSTPEKEKIKVPNLETQEQEKAKPEEPVKIKETEKITPRTAKTVEQPDTEISLEINDSNVEESFPQQAVNVAKSEGKKVEKPPKMAAAKVEKSAEQKKAPVAIRGVSSLRRTSKASDGDAVQFSQITNSALKAGKVVRGKVISLADSLPLTGAVIAEKGTSNVTVSGKDGTFTLQLTNKNDSALVASFIGMGSTEFHPTNDSVVTVGLEASPMALDEIVVTGAYTNKKTHTVGAVSRISAEKNIPASTVNGKDYFEKYLKKNAVLPDDYPSKKVIVKIKIHLDSDGEIKKIENKNNADSELFEKAKQLIFNGPKWKAKTINGTPVESELTLRIVFRKEK